MNIYVLYACRENENEIVLGVFSARKWAENAESSVAKLLEDSDLQVGVAKWEVNSLQGVEDFIKDIDFYKD